MKEKNIVSKESMQRVMQFFESLSDETRLKILLSLTEGSKNVNEIYNFVGKSTMTLSAISHQLKTLGNIDLVKRERKGKEIFYELSDSFCWCILKDAFNHYEKGTGCQTCMNLKNRRIK